MIDYALTHADEVDAILVWSFSRFSRNNVDAALYKQRLRRKGIDVISVTEPVSHGCEGELAEGILDLFNAYLPKVLARDCMRGVREAARRGFYPLSTRPYGYDRVKTKDGRATRYKLVPKPDEAAVVRRIFHLYVVERKGAKDIANLLNAEGLRTSTGKPWTVNRVLAILSNPIYIGTLEIHFTSPNAWYLSEEDR